MKYNTVIIGGGLSGLVASIFVAQAGHSVVLVERNEKLGGRASSEMIKGSVLNIGAHALYRSGAAMSIFQELGIPVEGGKLPLGGSAVLDGKLSPLPVSVGALLSSKSLTWKGKMRFAMLMMTMKRINPSPLYEVSWEEWVVQQFPHDRAAQQLMLSLGRLWSYADCPEMMSAGALIKQGQIGMDGVYYLHYGWQRLVESLKKRAEAEGVTILKGKVNSVITNGEKVEGVILSNEERIEASTVVAAISPNETIRLISDLEERWSKRLMQWVSNATTAYASCIDITVKKLPYPKRSFALHMERPLYYSNHSIAASLSSKGHQVVHLLKYQANEEKIDAAQDRKELETWMSTLQPGWQNSVVTERFIPKVTVTNAVPTVKMVERPTVDMIGLRGIFISGDWVGQQGMLADAAVASAKEASHEVIRQLRGSN